MTSNTKAVQHLPLSKSCVHKLMRKQKLYICTKSKLCAGDNARRVRQDNAQKD